MTESVYLFEALREMAFESCLNVSGHTLRIGLAATQWQLEQARILLESFHPCEHDTPARPLPALAANERAVAIVLNTALGGKEKHARAAISLRRDSLAGLALDAHHHLLLEQMRAKGARLVEIEQLAFAPKAPPISVLQPMLHALSGAVTDWGATDILAECAPRDAGFYCTQVGFKRLRTQSERSDSAVLLHLSAARLARLQARTRTKNRSE